MVKRSVYINAMNFISPFIQGKRLVRTDVISLGSIFLFASNMYCTKFKVYIHFMPNPMSIERGKLQTMRQNRGQSIFTDRVVKYLYNHVDFKNASVNAMLRNQEILKYYERITNIDDRKIQKNCDIKMEGLDHFDVSDKGYCVIVSK